MSVITIDRIDHIADLGDVLAMASFARGPAESIWQEFDNSLDALDLATDSQWAIATAAARETFEKHRPWIESQMLREDCPEFIDDDSEYPLLFVMTGRRALMQSL